MSSLSSASSVVPEILFDIDRGRVASWGGQALLLLTGAVFYFAAFSFLWWDAGPSGF